MSVDSYWDDLKNMKIINFWHSLDKNINQFQLDTKYDELKNEIDIYFMNKETKLHALELMSNVIILCAETRDCRGILGGKGLKDVSYWLYFKLLLDFPKTMLNLLPMFIDYGSWKDYQRLYEIAEERIYLSKKTNSNDNKMLNIYNQLKEEILNLWSVQLKYDYKKLRENDLDSISYCAKYIPKEKKSLDKKFGVFIKLATRMFGKSKTNRKDLRKLCSKLNKTINTTEILMCNKEFSKIRMREVPLKCIEKYKKAFKYEKNNMIRGNDTDRLDCRANYLNYCIFKNDVYKITKNNDKQLKTMEFLELMNDNRYLYIYDIIKDTNENMFQYLNE